VTRLHAPHAHIQASDERERFLIALFDRLWARYRERVSHVRAYERLIAAHGARFTNDHVAFRTLASDERPSGIFTLARLFEALGYRAAGCYGFPDKHLGSLSFEHARPELPKLFISELKTWELSPPSRKIVARHARVQRPALAQKLLDQLHDLARLSAAQRVKLLATVDQYIARLPWPRPTRKDVLALDEESQFGAWVLVNGHEVNHFTASVDSHGVATLDDIDKVQAAMLAAGIPMKPHIEGAKGSKLRQTSTEAVVLPTAVRVGSRTVEMPWTYAYFEIAERPLLVDPVSGRPERYHGFVDAQATHLFDMTKVSAKT
jgi:hypothetical protein